MGKSGKGLVAVAGATGYLGGHVVRALHRRGYRVRALTRIASKLDPIREACDEVFCGQATQAETLEGFCDGCEAVYLGLGIAEPRRRPTLWEVDYQANLNVLQVAERAGVRHGIFITAIHSDRLRLQGVLPAEARERVVDALRASTLRWTVFRGTGFFSDMARFFQMAARGTGWIIGDGLNRMNPVHGADLADEVVNAIEDAAYWDQELLRGGPEILTFREIYTLAFEALERPVKVRSVPRWLLAPARHVVRPFNGTLSGFLHAIQAMTAMPDLTAPACGSRRLSELFAELAQANR